jgi:D-3-phosphoglycerate dehydrogenase
MPKTLFIDSTPDIDRLWKRVHGQGDIAVAINMGPVTEGDIPGTLQGYDTCINDATYFTEATLKRCTGLKHIVFLGTGAGSFVDLAAAERLGIKVSTIKGYGDTAVASTPWVSSSPPPATSPPCTPSCARGAGASCRAWS